MEDQESEMEGEKKKKQKDRKRDRNEKHYSLRSHLPTTHLNKQSVPENWEPSCYPPPAGLPKAPALHTYNTRPVPCTLNPGGGGKGGKGVTKCHTPNR